MTLSVYEPPSLEITLTLGLGLSVLSPYYRSFVRRLDLRGDERVLDYGAGSGILSRHIAARLQQGDRRSGGHLDCVDISRGWQVVIRKTLRHYDNVDYYCGHITQLDLADGAYDMAVSHFVLHEVSAFERPMVMKSLAQKLKPHGRLILREPQDEGITPEELRQLAVIAGLQISSLEATKIAIGAVYDACFTQQQ